VFSHEYRRFIKDFYSTSGFQCLAMNMEGLLKIFTPHLVYRHIWLNLPRMIAIFFLHLPMDDSHLGYIKIKKSLQSTWGGGWGEVSTSLKVLHCAKPFC
jgi:hypothetical protein